MKKKIIVGISVMLMIVISLCGCTETIEYEHIGEVTLLEGESYTIPDTNINITLFGASHSFWASGCNIVLIIELYNESGNYILKHPKESDGLLIYGYTLKYVHSTDFSGTIGIRRPKIE